MCYYPLAPGPESGSLSIVHEHKRFTRRHPVTPLRPILCRECRCDLVGILELNLLSIRERCIQRKRQDRMRLARICVFESHKPLSILHNRVQEAVAVAFAYAILEKRDSCREWGVLTCNQPRGHGEWEER